MDLKIVLTCLCIFLPSIAVCLLNPTIGKYLKDTLNITPVYSGYIVGIAAVVFTIQAPIVGYLCTKLNRKLITFLGTVLCALSSIAIGDVKYLALQNNLTT